MGSVWNSGGVINDINTSSRRIASTSGSDTTWGYAILWRSSFVYTSALIRRSRNSAPHGTHDYQYLSVRPLKQRKTPTSEHSCVITLRALILAPPRGDDIYISFSYYFCIFFFNPHRNLRLSRYSVYGTNGCNKEWANRKVESMVGHPHINSSVVYSCIIKSICYFILMRGPIDTWSILISGLSSAMRFAVVP